jgi:hypothetical protein
MATTKTIPGPTPAGGTYSTAYFLNDAGKLVDEKDATQVNIVEFDKDGKQINRTYGTIDRTIKEEG